MVGDVRIARGIEFQMTGVADTNHIPIVCRAVFEVKTSGER